MSRTFMRHNIDLRRHETVTESAPCAANEPQRLSFGFVCCGARLWTLNVDDFRDVPGLELFK